MMMSTIKIRRTDVCYYRYRVPGKEIIQPQFAYQENSYSIRSICFNIIFMQLNFNQTCLTYQAQQNISDYIQLYQKMQSAIKNSKQFNLQVLKRISGEVPKEISGDYFRNGVATFGYGNQLIQHWFNGDGSILKVSFKNGQCAAQLKTIDTPLHRRRVGSQSVKQGILNKLWTRFRQGSQASNPANTSVLMLKNSPNFLALCEGGQPFIIKKEDLKDEGFSDFGWIKSAYSAHPKVDPDNGDIYNIGMSPPMINIMKSTKDMKKICQNSFKLRQIQSIHDFCLAGDYLILFQAPVRFSLKELLWGNKFFYQCMSFDKTLPTLVHVYSKQDLKHVKTFDFQPFYSFHFTNGYSNKQKIVVQYVKYDMDSAIKLFNMFFDIPKLSQNKQKGQNFLGTSTLQQLTINLSDFSTKTKSIKINGQFPVCEDNQVGKQWRYTYVVGSSEDRFLSMDTIYKYDRQKQVIIKNKLQKDAYVNQPCIIRTKKALYLLCIVNRFDKSYVQIFEAQSLKNVCVLQLPQFVAAGFHGKWDLKQ